MLLLILRGGVVIELGGCSCSECRRRVEIARACAAIFPMLGQRAADGALEVLALGEGFERRVAALGEAWAARRPGMGGEP